MPSSTTLPHDVEISSFDYRFKIPPSIYFHHTISGEAATLQVKVVGPSLSYTFKHSRAKMTYHATELGSNLFRKTVGFLTLIVNADERIVLAWAESGHGSSSSGEMLDATPFALLNASWTRRATAVTSLLGIKAGSMFDNPHGKHTKMSERFKGIFSGSHVEVKLATHAVFVLLRLFGITNNLDAVTVQDLIQLRYVRWTNDTRPAFEIHFSRAPCSRCKKFVRRLQRLTQITLRLQWHERLVPIEYDKGVNPNKKLEYAQDDTVSVCSEAESVDALQTEGAGSPSESVDTLAATDTGSLRAKIQDDDVLCIASNFRSVTPPLVIDLTKERATEPTAREVVDPGDVDKPLPATAEFSEPEWMIPQPRRSPRPYCSSFLGHGCTCGTFCSHS